MAQTLEDYLITLGLKVDKAQEQRFNSALDNLGKTFAALAAGLTAAAATIQATVVAVSKSFDNLYFAAQRTNSTVSGIKALSYAFSQIGASGGEAQSALEGLSKALRTNPGTAKWLNGQGIATEGRKTEAILSDIFEKYGKMPQWLGYQFAEVVGVSEETFNKASKQWPQVIAFMKEFEKTQAKFGVDPDKAAESSNKLMTSFRGLMMSLDSLLTKVTVALQPQLNQMLADIAKWFEEHQDKIVKVLDDILSVVQEIVGWVMNFARAVVELAGKLNDIIELLVGDKLSLKAALEAILVFMAGKWLLGILGVFNKITKSRSFGLLMLAMGMGYDMFFMTDEQKLNVGGDVNDAINGKASDPDNMWTRAQNAVRRPLGLPEVDNKGNPKPQVGAQGATGALDPKNLLPGVDTRLSAAIQAAAAQSEYDVKVQSGFRKGDPRFHGKGEAVDVKLFDRKTGKAIPNYQDASGFWQYKAFADRVHDEYIKGGGNPNDLRWGGYFSGPPGKYGALDTMHLDVAGRRGMPMGGGSWGGGPNEEQRRIWNLDRWKDKQSELFGAPALGSSSARSASISNRTSITVYGSSDPAGTAANLRGAQSRVASELIRNGQSAFV